MKLFNRFSTLFVAIIIATGLTACAMLPIDDNTFSAKPVPEHEPIIYECVGSTETFTNFKGDFDKLKIWSKKVKVVDTGNMWHATLPGNDGDISLISPELYSGLTGRVDGNINFKTGERYYRVNKPKTSFTYSNVNSEGNGQGYSFFKCTKI